MSFSKINIKFLTRGELDINSLDENVEEIGESKCSLDTL